MGEELKSIIARDLRIMFDDFGSNLKSGSREIVDALRYLVRDPQNGQSRDINPHRAVAVQIANAMGPSGSIDDYVERHRNDTRYADCAKLAIAKAILEGERRSTLYFDHHIEDGDVVGQNSQSWLSMFLRDLTRRLSGEQIYEVFNNIFIINFNYDRCVEHFTHIWLRQMYGFTDIEAADICAKIEIYHPYGKLGDLPFENPSKHIAFGGNVTGDRLLSMAANIRTYSESTLDSKRLQSARSALSEAQKVVFLGYGFHEQNMELITVPEDTQRLTLLCYATTMGVSKPRIELDKESICTSFRITDNSRLFFEHVSESCEKFWQQYGDVVSR